MVDELDYTNDDDDTEPESIHTDLISCSHHVQFKARHSYLAVGDMGRAKLKGNLQQVCNDMIERERQRGDVGDRRRRFSA